MAWISDDILLSVSRLSPGPSTVFALGVLSLASVCLCTAFLLYQLHSDLLPSLLVPVSLASALGATLIYSILLSLQHTRMRLQEQAPPAAILTQLTLQDLQRYYQARGWFSLVEITTLCGLVLGACVGLLEVLAAETCSCSTVLPYLLYILVALLAVRIPVSIYLWHKSAEAFTVLGQVGSRAFASGEGFHSMQTHLRGMRRHALYGLLSTLGTGARVLSVLVSTALLYVYVIPGQCASCPYLHVSAAVTSASALLFDSINSGLLFLLVQLANSSRLTLLFSTLDK